MNSTVSPYFHFVMNHKGLAAAMPTCPAYVDGRKRENSSFWKNRIIVASTCRTFRRPLLFCNLDLDGELCLRDGRNATFL